MTPTAFRNLVTEDESLIAGAEVIVFWTNSYRTMRARVTSSKSTPRACASRSTRT